MSLQQQQQQHDDAHVAFAGELTDAGDVASQGETTSVETPEGRLDHPDIEQPRGNSGRDFNLRHLYSSEGPAGAATASSWPTADVKCQCAA
mgnify:CR=1 FL=1